MNLYHLQYFIKLSELEHYTMAAESLQITQPSLSHAISTLEEELGVKLFEKSGRNIRITQSGKIFATQIEEALSIIDNAVDEMKQISKGSGHIRIGHLRTLSQQIVPTLARKFLEQNHDYKVSFAFYNSTGLSQDIIESLIHKKIDIAFCSKIENHAKITYVPIAKQELVLIVPTNHELANKNQIHLKQTLDFQQIWFSDKSGIRPVIDQIYKPFKKKPEIAYEVEEDETIAGLVAEGFGIAVIPRLPILDLLNVKIITLKDLKWERIFYMAYLTNAYHNPVLHNFIDFTQKNNPYITQ